MKATVKKVTDEDFSTCSTAWDYGIDKKKTVERHVKKCKFSENKDVDMQSNYEIGQMFKGEEEKILAEHLIMSPKLHYGLTPKTSRQFVYEFTIANNNKVPHKWIQSKVASYDWLCGFMHRHKQLSLRKSENTSLNQFNQLHSINSQ